jgi:Skp family chaperone for outer membrane proteins
MTFVRTALLRSALTLSAFAAVTTAAARPAAAQVQASVRIAVVNPAKVFNDMAETRALQGRMADEQKRFEADSKARATKLEEMKKGLGDLKPDSPQARRPPRR